MRYLSVCSGIEAASVAWEPLGWEPLAFSEIDPFASAVLAHHYPHVPNLGDMTKFQEWPDADIDLLVGGTPCQSFSVAGLRRGLRDPRGQLMLSYAGIAQRYRPRWIVWENVPGVLSSHGGRDFGTFLGALAELGYGFAWRVLDAQFVRTRRFVRAVPQRRRRVLVVGYLGDWRRAAAVLFDRESLRGNPPPRREAGQGFAGDPDAGAAGGGGPGLISMAHGQGNAEVGIDHSPTLTCIHEAPIVAFDCKASASGADAFGVSPTLRATGHAASHPNAGGQVADAFDAQAGGNTGLAAGDVAGALHGEGRTAVAFGSKPGRENQHINAGAPLFVTHALPWAVRRLTPEECEFLQAMPRGYTRIPYRGKPADKCPDGPRYRALGNSMAVNVMEWIGERIAVMGKGREK